MRNIVTADSLRITCTWGKSTKAVNWIIDFDRIDKPSFVRRELIMCSSSYSTSRVFAIAKNAVFACLSVSGLLLCARSLPVFLDTWDDSNVTNSHSSIQIFFFRGQ